MNLAPFSLPVRVYFQDTDAGGVTFHGAYLQFLERARTEWLRERGFDSRTLSERFHSLFMVRKLEINYRQPAVLDDLLLVTARIAYLGRAQLTFAQQVLRGTELLAEASVNVACVGVEDLRPQAIPQLIRNRCAEVHPVTD